MTEEHEYRLTGMPVIGECALQIKCLNILLHTEVRILSANWKKKGRPELNEEEDANVS